jgi:crossover junction endodeoxyribonuclease RusA
MNQIEFFVPGHPKAQGSKRHVGKGIMVESSKDLRPWRQAIAYECTVAALGRSFAAAVRVDATFFFQRPSAHYGTGRNAGQLKASAPRYRTPAPDLDKLLRALFDAIVISGVIRDDRYIVEVYANKVYGAPGVSVRLTDLT